MIKNIIILILILGFIATVVFLDLPGVQKIFRLRKQIENQEQAFLEKQSLFSKIESLKENYQDYQESWKKVDYILPPDKDMPNLIVQLEALALEGGLVLEDIGFSVYKEPAEGGAKVPAREERISKDYQTLLINLKLIGDYPSFKNFLKAVEENMRLMDVISVNFSSKSKEQLLFFEFNLSLKTYYQQ